MLDEFEFAKEVLPECLPDNRFQAFVRQLRLHGFHERCRLSDNTMPARESASKGPSEYYNQFFRRDRPNLLWLVGNPSVSKRPAVENANETSTSPADEYDCAAGCATNLVPQPDSPVHTPADQHGRGVTENVALSTRPDHKCTRMKGGSAAIHVAPPAQAPVPLPTLSPGPPPSTSTRPTRILIGHWEASSERDPRDRHAVYGTLRQDGKFRVKVVRETRDGRSVNGNYPSGRGACWISYEEVELEPHLKALNRAEVKEYCRVRQRQLDHDETPAERIDNETKAVDEAQIRVSAMPSKPDCQGESTAGMIEVNGRNSPPNHGQRPIRGLTSHPLSPGGSKSVSDDNVLLTFVDASNKVIGTVEKFTPWNPLIDKFLKIPILRDGKIKSHGDLTQDDLARVCNRSDPKGAWLLACMIQAGGQVMPKKCKLCAENWGPFEDCVRLEDSTFPNCGNCEWTGHGCRGASSSEADYQG